MEKMCAMCGRKMEIVDYYAYISTKYCKRCAAESKRISNANWAREFRRKRREENKLIRELCKEQSKEIEALKALVIRQRQEIRELETR